MMRWPRIMHGRPKRACITAHICVYVHCTILMPMLRATGRWRRLLVSNDAVPLANLQWTSIASQITHITQIASRCRNVKMVFSPSAFSHRPLNCAYVFTFPDATLATL